MFRFVLPPPQQTTRYLLLLKELDKATGPDHPDFELLPKALESMSGTAAAIDNAIGVEESALKLLELVSKFRPTPELDRPMPGLVKAGVVEENTSVSAKSMTLLLLSNGNIVMGDSNASANANSNANASASANANANVNANANASANANANANASGGGGGAHEVRAKRRILKATMSLRQNATAVPGGPAEPDNEPDNDNDNESRPESANANFERKERGGDTDTEHLVGPDNIIHGHLNSNSDVEKEKERVGDNGNSNANANANANGNNGSSDDDAERYGGGGGGVVDTDLTPFVHASFELAFRHYVPLRIVTFSDVLPEADDDSSSDEDDDELVGQRGQQQQQQQQRNGNENGLGGL